MSSLIISDFLAQAVDDQIEWLNHWNSVAFSDMSARAQQAENLVLPPSFIEWRNEALYTLPQDQPAIEKLVVLREQLQELARLVLIKTPDGSPIEIKDYENVVAKHQEFLQGLRRIERAFTAAASGLDQLTGLRSRLGLKEDLSREFNRFMRTETPFCVALMDIDHFKRINDTYGHEAGDRVLATVADHISRSIRPFDDAYRFGGEEFLICLKNADRMAGLTVMDRLRAGLERKAIHLAEGRAVNITASFGLIPSDKNILPEIMLQRADEALYEAKNKGRNKIVIAEVSGG